MRRGASLLLCGCLALLLTQGASGAQARQSPMTAVPPMTGLTGRDCRFAPVPGANGDSLMEIDVFGRHAPSCRSATRHIKKAVTSLTEETWGQVGAWRCIWAEYEVYCAKPRAKIYATNPGG